MGAVAPDAEVAGGAEDRLAEQVGRAVDDDPGEVPARRAGEDGVGHQAHRGLHVGRVDGSGGDLDQDVAGALDAQGRTVRLPA